MKNKKTERFNRVDTPEQIVRSIAEHEVFFSFFDDDGALAFREWWYESGSALFKKYHDERLAE